MGDFEEWWKNYPRKVAKGDARKAWIRTAKIRPPLANMIRALVVAKASEQWLKDGGTFIPYPATYLRGERWDDVPEIELGGVVNGQMWWDTVTGVDMKAKELGISEDQYESRVQFRAEVFRAAGVTPMKKTA